MNVCYKRLISLAGIVVGCALTAVFVARCALKKPLPATAPSANGLYVWQRHWSEHVEAAVETELEAGSHDLYLLEGELEYNGAAAQWHWTEVPDYLWRHPRVTAVFRLSVPALDTPGQSAEAIVSRASALGVHRLQLDVDVPERLIIRYAELLAEVRHRWPPERPALLLGATFLPCHLDLKDIRRALTLIDEPVIQLHGIDTPKHHDGHWALMKRKTVFRALQSARALDERFKMALPSYAYVLTFNADGSFRRLYAEGLPDSFTPPPGTVCELAAPNLDLLHDIFTSPLRLPVIWFRMPVPGVDRWCLERETLFLLERGERPLPSVEFTIRRGERTGTLDIFARYRHQIPLEGVTAAIDWGAGEMAGEFFPLNGCQTVGRSVHGRLPDSVRIAPFACGARFAIGKAITPANPAAISIREEKGQ